jgi:hypothetical protein
VKRKNLNVDRRKKEGVEKENFDSLLKLRETGKP